jgi:hypothetical protein
MHDLRILSIGAMAAATLVCSLPSGGAEAQASTAPGGEVGAPSPTHNPVADTQGGHAVTAPSGESPHARSLRCNHVANRKGLTGSARQEFRLSCMATAAPATHAGTKAPPKQTAARDDLGVSTPSEPH